MNMIRPVSDLRNNFAEISNRAASVPDEKRLR